MNNNVQKPYLKWAGGKSQIINQLLNIFPKKINNYHEIFLGGGSVLFALLSLKKSGSIIIEGKIFASDINKGLIGTYLNIQNNKDSLFNSIQKHLDTYNSILTDDYINRNPNNIREAKSSKESYYYWLRNLMNSSNDPFTVEYSALFMIINKFCFRGLYREGPNGFNVPFGHYKKTPTIISKDDIDSIFNLIKDVEFSCCDFSESFNKIKKGDFIYLDPPYVPEEKNSFVSYTKDGFDENKHNELFNQIHNISSHSFFVLCNSNTDLVLNSFENFNIEEITAKRSINSKNPESKTKELIINNFTTPN